jgi:hypothetical protein
LHLLGPPPHPPPKDDGFHIFPKTMDFKLFLLDLRFIKVFLALLIAFLSLLLAKIKIKKERKKNTSKET